MSNSNLDRTGFPAARGRWARVALMATVWLAVLLVAAGCGATAEPGVAPDVAPTDVPLDVAPSADVPTAAPTEVPTAAPTDAPTAVPTDVPTAEPTEMPAMAATDEPAAPSGMLPTAVPGDEAEVEIEDFAFNPPVLVIRVGTEVKWSNKDEAQHTATSDTGVWDSGYLSKGEDFFFTFTEPGEYPYYCIPHGGPGGVGMAGTVIVVE